MRSKCIIPSCSKPVHGRTWCDAHYRRWKRTGSPMGHSTDWYAAADVRFWNRVLKTAGCWEWQGNRRISGYGRLQVEGRETQAHRFAYELLIGPIPDGLDIDHLCRNRGCVNPAHMEPVTPTENTLRGVGAAAINARKTHCIRGHPFNLLNTVYRQGFRQCRTCEEKRWRSARERNRIC